MNRSLVGTQLGEYIVGEQIDEGGMGAIYRVFRPDSNDALVMKVLLPDLSEDESFRKRFEREIGLLQTLQHPHIVPVYDLGEQDGMLYFVMPYIRGSTLSSLLRKDKFSPATAWIIIEPIAQALTYAHEKRVIHRDLKPDNILVETHKSGMMRPFLVDFGLGKPIDRSALTQSDVAIGTPQYMAPEQVRGQAVTARTDVYALGTLVYEMLLGTVPFPKGSPDAIALKQVREMPPPPRALNIQFPASLEAVILKALMKDPNDRYDSTEAFSAAYWQALQELPLAARMTHYSSI